MPVLKTERLVLRAPRLDDAPALVPLINDRRIAENLSRVPHPYSRKDAETFIAVGEPRRRAGRIPRDAARRHARRRLRGRARSAGAHPEIGYWFGVPHWGRGYATEAARAVIDYAFDDLGHETLEGGARVSNPASRRVLEKCGYVWTGVVLAPRARARRRSVPCDRFRLDRADWQARSRA